MKHEVHRVFKMRVGSLQTLRRKGARTTTFFSVIMWLISTGAVAALAVYAVPRFFHQQSLLSASTAAPRAAVLNRAAVWEGLPPHETFKKLTFNAFVGGALFDPRVLRGCVDMASETIEALRMQCAPLSSEADCLRAHAVPNMPIAAVGLASAVASVLTTKPVELLTESEVAQLAQHAGLAAFGSMHGEATFESSASEFAALSAHSHATDELDVSQALLSARLCGSTYFSCDMTDAWEVTARLEEECEAAGLRLIRELHGGADEYAFVAQEPSGRVSVVFRGSCTLKNVLTDIDMVRGHYAEKETAAELLARATGMPLKELAGGPMTLHRGFVEAYLALREDLLETLGDLAAQFSPRAEELLEVHVTGPSMGGAMAMLAALELDYRRQHHGLGVARPQTYTFAAPRLGDKLFADLYTRTFPEPADHWALQAPSDAVPHLPFAAWGFRHPSGVAKLGGSPSFNSTPEGRTRAATAVRAALRRSTDAGDSVHALRPKDGDMRNWAFCHDLNEYVHHLRAMVGDVTEGEFQP